MSASIFRLPSMTDRQEELYATCRNARALGKDGLSQYNRKMCNQLVKSGVFVETTTHYYLSQAVKDRLTFFNERAVRRTKQSEGARAIIDEILEQVPAGTPKQAYKGLRCSVRFGGEENEFHDQDEFRVDVLIHRRNENMEFHFSHGQSLRVRNVTEHRTLAENILAAMDFQEFIIQKFSAKVAALNEG